MACIDCNSGSYFWRKIKIIREKEQRERERLSGSKWGEKQQRFPEKCPLPDFISRAVDYPLIILPLSNH